MLMRYIVFFPIFLVGCFSKDETDFEKKVFKRLNSVHKNESCEYSYNPVGNKCFYMCGSGAETVFSWVPCDADVTKEINKR